MTLGTTSYPAALDNAASLGALVNNCASTVASGFMGGGTSLALADATLFPATGGFIYVGGERGTYMGKSSSTLTGVSGLGNNHLAGEAVELRYDAGHHNAVSEAIQALQTLVGVTGDSTAGRVIARLSALEAAASPKMNLTATTNPGSGNDSSQGYGVGSKWVNTGTQEAYECVKATVGAAVWLNTTLTISELGGGALLNVGTAAGTVAAGNHTHATAAVTDFAEAVDDRVAALLVAGSNVALTYNDVANTLTVAVSGTFATQASVNETAFLFSLLGLGD